MEDKITVKHNSPTLCSVKFIQWLTHLLHIYFIEIYRKYTNPIFNRIYMVSTFSVRIEKTQLRVLGKVSSSKGSMF